MVILYIIGGVVALVVLWMLALAIITKTADAYHYIKGLALDRAGRERILREPTQIWTDQVTGSYPLLHDPGSGRVLDADRGLLYDNDGLLNWSPEVHAWSARRRIIQSLSVSLGSIGDRVAGLLAAPSSTNQWPTEVPLKSVVTEPDIGALTLGVTIGDDGQRETVKADMSKLVHIAVGGSSGWGKSVFLRSLAYQLALSQTPVDLALIDLEGATFAPFARCGRLLWPVADTEKDALAIFRELTREMDKRKELYNEHPGVDSIAAYNARADEPLTPLVCLVDEATALLGDKAVEGALRTLALRARKYGLWLVLGGQDWKASSLDTAIRNQLSSRIQFKAMSASQSRVLLERGGAEELDVAGRAWAVIPGKSPFMMQAPFINSNVIMADVSNGGARFPMPEAGGNGGTNSEMVRRIKELAAQGVSKRQICLDVFGYTGGAAFDAVSRVLE